MYTKTEAERIFICGTIEVRIVLFLCRFNVYFANQMSDMINSSKRCRIKQEDEKMNQKSNLTLRKVFERFSYGCGDFGCNIIYTAMSAFLLFYYTD